MASENLVLLLPHVNFKKGDNDKTLPQSRECGDEKNPTMILFHGFPSTSHQFCELMPKLEDKFHLIAPDYPGFGQSENPSREKFAYTFEHLAEVMDAFLDAIKIEKFYMYVFDYGAPIGFRIALKIRKGFLEL